MKKEIVKLFAKKIGVHIGQAILNLFIALIVTVLLVGFFAGLIYLAGLVVASFPPSITSLVVAKNVFEYGVMGIVFLFFSCAAIFCLYSIPKQIYYWLKDQYNEAKIEVSKPKND